LSTNESKRDAIEALALAIARGDLKILPDRTLLAELKAFQAERLPSGLLRVCGPAWDEEHSEKAKASRKPCKK
jgi:hypothetical protein